MLKLWETTSVSVTELGLEKDTTADASRRTAKSIAVASIRGGGSMEEKVGRELTALSNETSTKSPGKAFGWRERISLVLAV